MAVDVVVGIDGLELGTKLAEEPELCRLGRAEEAVGHGGEVLDVVVTEAYLVLAGVACAPHLADVLGYQAVDEGVALAVDVDLDSAAGAEACIADDAARLGEDGLGIEAEVFEGVVLCGWHGEGGFGSHTRLRRGRYCGQGWPRRGRLGRDTGSGETAACGEGLGGGRWVAKDGRGGDDGELLLGGGGGAGCFDLEVAVDHLADVAHVEAGGDGLLGDLLDDAAVVDAVGLADGEDVLGRGGGEVVEAVADAGVELLVALACPLEAAVEARLDGVGGHPDDAAEAVGLVVEVDEVLEDGVGELVGLVEDDERGFVHAADGGGDVLPDLVGIVCGGADAEGGGDGLDEVGAAHVDGALDVVGVAVLGGVGSGGGCLAGTCLAGDPVGGGVVLGVLEDEGDGLIGLGVGRNGPVLQTVDADACGDLGPHLVGDGVPLAGHDGGEGGTGDAQLGGCLVLTASLADELLELLDDELLVFCFHCFIVFYASQGRLATGTLGAAAKPLLAGKGATGTLKGLGETDGVDGVVVVEAVEGEEGDGLGGLAGLDLCELAVAAGAALDLVGDFA